MTQDTKLEGLIAKLKENDLVKAAYDERFSFEIRFIRPEPSNMFYGEVLHVFDVDGVADGTGEFSSKYLHKSGSFSKNKITAIKLMDN